MKTIAIALHNGKLANHFGRTEVFAVFDLSANHCFTPMYRVRGHLSQHRLEHAEDDSHDHHTHGEGHQTVLKILHGCDTVISGGMGHRIAEALRTSGIEPVVTRESGSPEELCQKYLQGTLEQGEVHSCCHHHT